MSIPITETFSTDEEKLQKIRFCVANNYQIRFVTDTSITYVKESVRTHPDTNKPILED